MFHLARLIIRTIESVFLLHTSLYTCHYVEYFISCYFFSTFFINPVSSLFYLITNTFFNHYCIPYAGHIYWKAVKLSIFVSFLPPLLISEREFPHFPPAETSSAAFPFLPHTHAITQMYIYVHLTALNICLEYRRRVKISGRKFFFMQTKEGLRDQTQSKHINNLKTTLKQTVVSRKANSIQDCCPQTFVVKTFETKRVSKQVKAPGLCVYLFMFSLCRLEV